MCTPHSRGEVRSKAVAKTTAVATPEEIEGATDLQGEVRLFVCISWECNKKYPNIHKRNRLTFEVSGQGISWNISNISNKHGDIMGIS